MVKLKELYVANSIDELAAMVELPDLKKKNVNRYVFHCCFFILMDKINIIFNGSFFFAFIFFYLV